MGETNIWVELEKIFSLGDDLIGVLNCKKDGDSLMEFLEDAKALQSFCEAHALENKVLLEEHRKKVNECKEKMEKLKSEGIAVSKLDDLQTELGNKMELERLLREDLRVVSDELVSLEHRRVHIEERQQQVKKREKDMQKSQDSLSMCASVTKIIPDLNDQTKISGFVVERSNKKVDKFEFEPTTSPYEICNSLWKMASH